MGYVNKEILILIRCGNEIWILHSSDCLRHIILAYDCLVW